MRKGVSLYIALLVLSILFGISLGLSAILTAHLKMARGVEESVMAFYAADAGIERNLFEFSSSYPRTDLPNGTFFETRTTCAPSFDSCQDVCPGCAFDDDCDAPRFCIRSVGKLNIGNTQRAILVRY